MAHSFNKLIRNRTSNRYEKEIIGGSALPENRKFEIFKNFNIELRNSNKDYAAPN